MSIRVSEAITVVYVLYLAGCAWVRPLSPGRRRRVLATAVVVIVTILLFAAHGRAGPLLMLRDWAPAAFLLVGTGCRRSS